jgi:hypothetical protein
MADYAYDVFCIVVVLIFAICVGCWKCCCDRDDYGYSYTDTSYRQEPVTYRQQYVPGEYLQEIQINNRQDRRVAKDDHAVVVVIKETEKYLSYKTSENTDLISRS